MKPQIDNLRLRLSFDRYRMKEGYLLGDIICDVEKVFSSVIFIHAFLAWKYTIILCPPLRPAVTGPCSVGARERDRSDQSVAATAAAAQPRTEVSSSPTPRHKYRRHTEDIPDTRGGLRHPDTQKIFIRRKNTTQYYYKSEQKHQRLKISISYQLDPDYS